MAEEHITHTQAALDEVTPDHNAENTLTAQSATAGNAPAPAAAGHAPEPAPAVAASSPAPDPAMPEHITYLDCLKGTAPIPTDHVRKFLFQLLMVGGMVTFMATYNGIRHDGLDFVRYMHWFYPVVFCVAFLIRYTLGDAITNPIISHLIAPRLTGVPKAVAITAANVVVMCPMVSLVVSVLLAGNDFLSFYLEGLPLSAPFAMLVSYFLVGPAVKVFCYNYVRLNGASPIIVKLRSATRFLTVLFGGS
ncbi:MAG: hypothetical protein Q4E12_00965 [Coriobacteriia bacterium]|nr:hypothetical protein [Coriobacteriia bacterium]